jgi:hypothetical protein
MPDLSLASKIDAQPVYVLNVLNDKERSLPVPRFAILLWKQSQMSVFAVKKCLGPKPVLMDPCQANSPPRSILGPLPQNAYSRLRQPVSSGGRAGAETHKSLGATLPQVTMAAACR